MMKMFGLASSEEVESEDPAIAWTVPDEDDTAQFTEREEAGRQVALYPAWPLPVEGWSVQRW